MGVRIFGRNAARFALLAAGTIVLAGCWTDIPYDPASDTQSEAEDAWQPQPLAEDLPAQASPPETPALSPQASEPLVSTQPDAEFKAEDFGAEEFGDELAGMAPPETEAAEAEETPAEEASPDGFDDPFAEALFDAQPLEDAGTTAAEPLPEEPTPNELDTTEVDTPESAAAVADKPAAAGTEVRLPWEIDGDETPETKPPASEAQGVPEAAPLPWETPEVVEDPKRDEPERDESTSAGPADTSEPASEPADAANDWQPAPTAPGSQPAEMASSQQLAWRLSSRLSTLLLEPDVDVGAAADELTPVATALGIELPRLYQPSKLDRAAQLREFLAVGRDLGQRVASRHGAEHAALVEIAFKSSLLLAVAESRPQLKQSIRSSVSAAAVRAGLPESIWQPWQTRVAGSNSASALAAAVVDLHDQIGNYYTQGSATESDSAPSMLR